jgi:hypothetical protein
VDVRVIEETDFAAEGSIIRAKVNGKTCGTATVPPADLPGENDFPLYVEGARSTPGCARAGDVVQFELDGKIGDRTLAYAPFALQTTADALPPRPVTFADLVFATDYAWYWSDDVREADGSPIPAGRSVTAMIGGMNCGTATSGGASGGSGDAAGFGRLLVPTSRLKPGCGSSGATVRIFVGGKFVATAPWLPGSLNLGSLRLSATDTFYPRVPDFAAPGATQSTVTISWDAIEPAASYALSGTLRVVRENALAACDTPPLQYDTRELNLDARITAPATTFEIALPALAAADRWSVIPASVNLTALDSAGNVLTGVGLSAIVESCGFARAQRIQPPATGDGSSGDGGRAVQWWPLLAAGLALVIGGVAMRCSSIIGPNPRG